MRATYNSGKGLLRLHSYKDLVSKHFQRDLRWYRCDDFMNEFGNNFMNEFHVIISQICL